VGDGISSSPTTKRQRVRKQRTSDAKCGRAKGRSRGSGSDKSSNDLHGDVCFDLGLALSCRAEEEGRLDAPVVAACVGPGGARQMG
jgi:hypothetical protein